MRWRYIDGLLYPYRVGDHGEMQKQQKDGKWIALRIQMQEAKSARVKVKTKDGGIKYLYLAKLVWTAFRGPVPAGKVIGIKNGVKQDCALENLFLTTREERGKTTRSGNCRPVEKVDRKGNVVAIYPSAAKAARANHVSESGMREHCRGQVKDIYSLDGYAYRYETRVVGRHKKQMEGWKA